MGWTRGPVLRFTHQASASAARWELTRPDRRSLIPVTPTHLTIRCPAFPAAIRPGTASTWENRQPESKRAAPRWLSGHAAGDRRRIAGKTRISIVRDQRQHLQ